MTRAMSSRLSSGAAVRTSAVMMSLTCCVQDRRAVAVQPAHDVPLADDPADGPAVGGDDQRTDPVLVQQVDEGLDGCVGATVTTRSPLLRMTSEMSILATLSRPDVERSVRPTRPMLDGSAVHRLDARGNGSGG